MQITSLCCCCCLRLRDSPAPLLVYNACKCLNSSMYLHWDYQFLSLQIHFQSLKSHSRGKNILTQLTHLIHLAWTHKCLCFGRRSLVSYSFHKQPSVFSYLECGQGLYGSSPQRFQIAIKISSGVQTEKRKKPSAGRCIGFQACLVLLQCENEPQNMCRSLGFLYFCVLLLWRAQSVCLKMWKLQEVSFLELRRKIGYAWTVLETA